MARPLVDVHVDCQGVLVVIGSGATPVGTDGGWGDPVVVWVIAGAVVWGLGKQESESVWPCHTCAALNRINTVVPYPICIPYT